MNTNPKEDDTFYDDMDKSRIHNSCCSCYSLIVLFIISTVLICFGVGWIYWKVTREIKIPNFSSKIANLNELKTRISDSLKTSNDQIEIPLREAEFNYLIGEGFSFGNFLFQNPQAVIDNDKITIYADLVKPLNAKVKFTTIPVANKGRVEFPVSEFDAGNMKISGFILNQFSPMLSQFISSKLELFYNFVYVDNVRLEQSKIIIIGKGK